MNIKKLLSLLLITFFSSIGTGSTVSFSLIVSTEDGKTKLKDAAVTMVPLFKLTETNSVKAHEMSQKDEVFIPKVLTVKTGDMVTFPNQDNFNHHVYSFSKTKTFELPFYKKGDPLPPPIKIEKSGITIVGCNIHDSMRAYIVSSPSPFHGVTNSSGLVRIDNLPKGKFRLEVWHPGLPTGSKPKAFSVDTNKPYQSPPTIKLNAKPLSDF